MIHMITGRAGTGKTTLLIQKIQEAAREESSGLIFVVPEQFSFETERALYKALGAETMLRVEVLSFKRLAQSVFRSCGGMAGNYLTPAARAVTMSTVLYDVKESLELYAPQAENPAFLPMMCRAVAAFKNADVPPARILEAAEETPEDTLRRKLRELAVIYQGFEAAIDGKYTDEDDDLARACVLAEESRFFENRQVFFDQFLSFTGLEYRMLATLFRQCGEVWFSLCCDEKNEPYGLFSPVWDTIGHLRALARENGQAVAPPVRLTEPYRFANRELKALEAGMYSPVCDPYPEKPENVRLALVRNGEEEVLCAAQYICHLVREKGYRYRDILLFSRSPEKYRMYLEELFPAYGIPFFLDQKADIGATPITRYLSTLFDCMASRFQTGDMLSLAKNPLSGLSELEAAALENYAFVWDIRGKRWLSPFTGHPAGLQGRFSEEDKEELENLNHLRERFAAPLQQLAEKLASGKAELLCGELYRYLKEAGIPGKLEELSSRLEEEGEPFLAGEQWEVWRAVLAVLDSIAVGLKGRELTLARFAKLFSAGISACELGKIPEHTDEVLVGDVSRTRSGEKRAVILLGVTEGEFPAPFAPGGVFTDQDARALAQMGLSFAKTGEDTLFDEQLYAYQAMTTAKELLLFTLPAGDLAGKELLPSSIVRQLRAIFPKGLEFHPSLHGREALRTKESALREYFEKAREREGDFAALQAYFSEDPQAEGALARSLSPLPDSLTDPALAGKLYGSRLLLSPSRVEKYYQCPFAYYLTYGLRLQTPRQAELSPIETGSVIHYCLERLVRRYGAKNLSRVEAEELGKTIDALLTEYLEREMGGFSDKPSRFGYLFSRLSATVRTLIKQLAEEFDQSAFEPVDFELEISPEGDIPPVTLRTPDGGVVQVVGRVDRVDTCRIGDETYVRVVDYKTGSTKFALNDVMQGLGLQMLLYLFTIWKNGGRRYGENVPAGVLYLPAVNPVVKAGRNADSGTVESLRRKGLKMNGLLLSDPEVIRAMESEAKGIFIPAALKKNGEPDARSSVASLEQMGALSRHIDQMVVQMASQLRAGKVVAAPLERNDRLPCEYCEFGSICRVDREKKKVVPEKIGNVLERLTKEENV